MWSDGTSRRTLLGLLGVGMLGLGGATSTLHKAAANSRPPDVEGWRAARWGMNDGALQESFGDSLIALPGRWEYGGAYADRALTDVDLGGVSFMALFQMNEQSGRLQQVLLERRRIGATPVNFDIVMAELVGRYGPPDQICAAPRSAAGALALEAQWRFPTTTIRLSFVDFRTTGVFSREPGAPIDPLVPYRDTRRNNRRFMPRRIFLRYHPSDRKDLESPLDCPDDRGQ